MLGATWETINDYLSKDRSGQVLDWLKGTPNIVDVSPTLVSGFHPPAPSLEQQQNIWQLSDSDIAAMNGNAWGSYIAAIHDDVVNNAPDYPASNSPLTKGIETLVIVGVIGLVGLKLYKSL